MAWPLTPTPELIFFRNDTIASIEMTTIKIPYPPKIVCCCKSFVFTKIPEVNGNI